VLFGILHPHVRYRDGGHVYYRACFAGCVWTYSVSPSEGRLYDPIQLSRNGCIPVRAMDPTQYRGMRDLMLSHLRG
jgi:hypothetical protein